jgi:hypothetical protein
MPSFAAGSPAPKTPTVNRDTPTKQDLSNSIFQLEDNRPETAVQRELGEMANGAAVQKRENRTGLPDQLKSGIEDLSGYSMDDVKVHFNSSQPAQLQAHAYAQGTDIHVAPGQEKHLPHEAWHVVQQKQGRVKPTVQLKAGIDVNDDAGLEKEADVMGAKALQSRERAPHPGLQPIKNVTNGGGTSPAQLKVSAGKFNVVGEHHNDYDGNNARFLNGRSDEQKFLKERFGLDEYWTESEFKGEEKTSEGKSKRADPIIDHVRVQLLALIGTITKEHSDALSLDDTVNEKVVAGIQRYWRSAHEGFLAFFGPGLVAEGYLHQDENFPVEPAEKLRLKNLSKLVQEADDKIRELRNLKSSEKDKWFDFTKKRNKTNQQKILNEIGILLHKIDMGMGNTVYDITQTDAQDILVNSSREAAMIGAAERAGVAGYVGTWKIGDSHINNMLKEDGPHQGTKGKRFTITTRTEYWSQLDAEMEARAQHERDKRGGLVLVPGKGAKEVDSHPTPEFTGVKSEKNVKHIAWEGSSYSGK